MLIVLFSIVAAIVIIGIIWVCVPDGKSFGEQLQELNPERIYNRQMLEKNIEELEIRSRYKSV